MTDLAKELTEILARADRIGAIRRVREATGLGLHEAKLAVERFEATGELPSLAPPRAPGTIPEDVRVLAERGDVIGAIKLLREHTGLGLQEAKAAVDGLRPASKKSGCGTGLWLFLAAGAAWLA